MSWRKMPMKFPGICIVCKGRIQAGEVGLWAKGMGVKHEGCDTGAPDELACAVCGGPAGCGSCEMREDCDIPNVSQMCICKKCADAADPFASYRTAVGKKFPLLRAGAPDPPARARGFLSK